MATRHSEAVAVRRGCSMRKAADPRRVLDCDFRVSQPKREKSNDVILDALSRGKQNLISLFRPQSRDILPSGIWEGLRISCFGTGAGSVDRGHAGFGVAMFVGRGAERVVTQALEYSERLLR